jgi:hypothetical protein
MSGNSAVLRQSHNHRRQTQIMGVRPDFVPLRRAPAGQLLAADLIPSERENAVSKGQNGFLNLKRRGMHNNEESKTGPGFCRVTEDRHGKSTLKVLIAL